MSGIAALFASGGVADLVLVVTIVEAVGLLAYRRRTGRGPAARDVVAMLAAGACLMLALRGALVGAAWPWIALALVGALVAHLADLGLRWRTRSSSSPRKGQRTLLDA